MEKWRGKVALITGASAGIGYALAKQLVELGINVVGCARNTAKIEELSHELTSKGEDKFGKLISVKCNVANEDEIKAMFSLAKSQFGGIDVCVNNAGLAHDAPILSGSTADWKNMLEVNILGLCMCTREFVTQLQERSVTDGHIILLNSMSGHRLISTKPNTFFYGATKFAVTALTEGIRQELREMKSNVKVTSISPGLVKTEFRGRLEKRTDHADMYKDVAGALESEDVVGSIIYVLSTPPGMQVHDILMRNVHQQR